MPEYIEREALLKVIAGLRENIRLKGGQELEFTETDIAGLLSVVPAADVAPVRHGRWIEGAENFTCGNHNAECSVCHCNISWNGCDEDYNYCPACGARTDGGG